MNTPGGRLVMYTPGVGFVMYTPGGGFVMYTPRGRLVMNTPGDDWSCTPPGEDWNFYACHHSLSCMQVMHHRSNTNARTHSWNKYGPFDNKSDRFCC